MTPKRKQRIKDIKALDKAAGRRKKLPSIPKLKKELKKVLHPYIIKRDVLKYEGWCPTCQFRKGGDQYRIESANHIFSVGDYPALQFNERAIYGGCHRCNCAEMSRRSLWANYFRRWMGSNVYDALECLGRQAHKWDRGELMELIEKYKLEGL